MSMRRCLELGLSLLLRGLGSQETLFVQRVMASAVSKDPERNVSGYQPIHLLPMSRVDKEVK